MVMNVQKEKQLWLGCDYFPGYGGPARAQLCYELVSDGGMTKVRLTESLLGAVDEKQLASMEQGWSFLLDCLKARCEGRPEPEWEGGTC